MSQQRKDPVSGRWVVFNPDVTRKVETLIANPPEHPKSETCIYCEGREAETPGEILAYRKDGSSKNGAGWLTRIVPSSVPVLRVEEDAVREGVGMFDMVNGVGAHEIIVETPDHSLDITSMDIDAIEKVFSAWKSRIEDLRKDKRLRYVLIFKNHGELAGNSIGHSHSQVLALPMTPLRIRTELETCKKYFDYKQRCLLCDVIREEKDFGERIVFENECFLAIEPFASRYPFETWILPKTHQSDILLSVSGEESRQLAEVLKTSLAAIKQALLDPPYNLVLHTIPNKIPRNGYWETIDQDYHWHLEILPRVTRATGFEKGSGCYVNPVFPEEAAEFLREKVKTDVVDKKEGK